MSEPWTVSDLRFAHESESYRIRSPTNVLRTVTEILLPNDIELTSEHQCCKTFLQETFEDNGFKKESFTDSKNYQKEEKCSKSKQ